MSGPKYYNFPMSSPEEAAGIYAQLTSFQLGVRVRVVNNELEFTVSNDAWYAGANFDAIKERVEKAKAQYEDNEERKRLLKEKKAEVKEKINEKKKTIDQAYQEEKKKLEEALSTCRKIEKTSQKKEETHFGTFGLVAEGKKVNETTQKITARLSALNNEYESAKKTLAECSNKIERCNDIQNIAVIQREYSAVVILKSTLDKEVQALDKELAEKSKALKRFTGFLEDLYDEMQNRDLSGYFERIKAEVVRIDIFADDALERINKILRDIEDEIKELNRCKEIQQESAEIRDKIYEQLNILTSLKDKLQPVIESIQSTTTVSVDYTPTATKIVDRCNEVISSIENLEFISPEHKGKIEGLKKQLKKCENSMRAEGTVELLQNTLRDFQELEKSCVNDNEMYLRLKAEQERYLELYTKLQGVLSVEENELSADATKKLFPSESGNTESEIVRLHELNKQLSTILEECFQTSVCAAFSASIEQSTWGKVFKKEKYEDNSLHMTYVHEANKGAIFDVSCTQDGKVGVFPRGVVLCNGKKTITPGELSNIFSSCAWASELADMIRGFGINGITYEEMSQRVLDALCDESNYYHIEDVEGSLEFLMRSGYSDEEIQDILEMEGEVIKNKRKKEEDSRKAAYHN